MNWLATGTCAAIADFSWLIGAICASIIDIGVLIAIARTPRLREHGGAPPDTGLIKRVLPWVPAILIVIIWFLGLHHVGPGLLSCYAAHGAVAASLIVGLLMLVLFPLAATQIGRRSIW
jgi:hypothetical protein